jgi:hypothetical protein
MAAAQDVLWVYTSATWGSLRRSTQVTILQQRKLNLWSRLLV